MELNRSVEEVLAELPSLLFQSDTLGLREALERLYDCAQLDLWQDLCTAQDAAAAWGVSERRARAYIARQVEQGRLDSLNAQQIGGTWVLRRAWMNSHPPDAKHRPKRKVEASDDHQADGPR